MGYASGRALIPTLEYRHAHTPLIVRDQRGFPCREVDVAYARIIRQWADGTVIVSEVGSDLDTVDQLIVAAARLDQETLETLPDEAEPS